MSKTTRISTVTGYLQAISKLEEVNGRTRFFRGHSNAEKYKMVPGIYRENIKGKSLVNYETQIYRDVITQAPQDFEGKNTLESLALMQHYGVPTRILDVTLNALVGLYFACNSNSGEKGADGEVIVLDVPKDSTCHYNSDRIAVLANLVKDNYVFYDSYIWNKLLSLLEKRNVFCNKIESDKIKQEEQNSLQWFNLKLSSNDINIWYEENRNDIILRIKESLKLCFDLKSEISVDNLIKDVFYDKNDSKSNQMNDIELLYLNDKIMNDFNYEVIKLFNNEVASINNMFFSFLIHNIKEDKPYFLPLIDPRDLHSIYAVKPKLDNPRIIRQQGAFLVFGIVKFDNYNDYDEKCLSVNQDWFVKNKEGEKLKIMIDKNSKKSILEELEILGISQATLFPEIDKVADSVRKKYEGML